MFIFKIPLRKVSNDRVDCAGKKPLADQGKHERDTEDEEAHGGRDFQRLPASDSVEAPTGFGLGRHDQREGKQMLRVRFCLAAALCAALVGQAFGADTRDTVARKFGEAFALAERCPTLKANTTRMGVYTTALGVKVDKAFEGS